ncbi:hypothetical protein ACFLZO_01650, partial [Patescibacteria group bacterium]
MSRTPAPTTTDDKLYNVGGSLYWDGTDISTSTAPTLQAAYNGDVDGSDVLITTNSTDGDVVIAGDQDFRVTATGDSIFDTSTLVIDSSADSVGIGTATPSAKLDVDGSAVFN